MPPGAITQHALGCTQNRLTPIPHHQPRHSLLGHPKKRTGGVCLAARVGAARRLAVHVPWPDTSKHTDTDTDDKQNSTVAHSKAETQRLFFLQYTYQPFSAIYLLHCISAHALQPHGLTGSHARAQPFIPAAPSVALAHSYWAVDDLGWLRCTTSTQQRATGVV